MVGTFANNTIKPEVFGDEVNREADYFPGVVVGIEKNNHGHTTIARARQLGVNLLKTPGKDTKAYRDWETDRKSTRLNSSHSAKSRMPSSA